MAIIQTLDTFAGSPFLYQESVASMAFGIDTASSDAIKLVALATNGAVVSGTAQLTIGTTTNGAITLAPNGTGATVLANGDLDVDAGNIFMPASTSAQGIYYINATPFMSDFGNSNNVFLGANAGNFTGSFNMSVFVGASAGGASVTSQNNTLIGSVAGGGLTTGSNNTLVGSDSCEFLTTGSSNIALGAAFYATFPNSGGALARLVSGNNNIAIGSMFNSSPNGSGPGYNYTTSESNNIVIGGATVGTTGESNVMRLGTSGSGSGQVNATYVAGIYGVNVGSVASVVSIDSSGQLGETVITAGAGVSVTAGANTITIASSGGGGGLTWYDVTGGSATMAAGSGYIADSGSLTTLTLPANNAFGDTIKVVGKGAGGWKIVYATGQNIVFGTSTSATTTGDISSNNASDCVEIVCTTASATAPIFTVISSIGNITIV